jgi:hypothetical protein
VATDRTSRSDGQVRAEINTRPARRVFRALSFSPYADDMDADLAEGWYLDPYQIHRDRWMSEGRPTRLVRDGQTESYDEPQDLPLPDVLVPVAPARPADESDRRRADESCNDPPCSAEKARRAVFDFFDQLPPY